MSSSQRSSAFRAVIGRAGHGPGAERCGHVLGGTVARISAAAAAISVSGELCDDAAVGGTLNLRRRG